ncbi:MAG: serine/threonine protein kinase, partial [Planctomycetes bacterium]|nr:serine/threonine protein kinase [Planctomycetota bacterium]
MGEHGDSGAADWLLSALEDEEPLAGGGPRPRTLGPYRLGAPLGRGATSVVFAATHLRSGREVALKVVRLDEVSSSTAERIKTEAAALARLTHPGIVRLLDWGRDGGVLYLALELVEGDSLAERIEREGALSERSALEIVGRLARAVEHAHQHGVLHRDLKPSNVLLDRVGVPRLTDFGLARLLDRSTRHTADRDLLGTPGYMAPELAGGRLDELGPATDVYCLGATLYACISGGIAPLQSKTLQEFLAALEFARPTPLRTLRPGLSAGTHRLCMRCLEAAPKDRYASAAQLAEAIDAQVLALERGRPAGAWRDRKS